MRFSRAKAEPRTKTKTMGEGARERGERVVKITLIAPPPLFSVLTSVQLLHG